MLFNSYEFLFGFLPVTLLGFYLAAARLGARAGIVWLIAASAFFYGWWNPRFVLLLAASMGVNYLVGTALARQAAEGRPNRPLLLLGVAGNLAVLGYFKYAGFFVAAVGEAFGTGWSIGPILLPLAISFFTFQKIVFLVDSYRGVAEPPDFLDYVLFVLFFPQLIAGPIVHYKEVIPQFAASAARPPLSANLAIGLTIFAIGLFKKVVLADGIAPYATSTFAAAAAGEEIEFFHAWSGALAYTFQLYFDFSGYSDMAIGAARMFGILLPLNFNSPYRATSIIDFWRRWHITLSRFLRDYLYIPLGGRRRGKARWLGNLMITMLLGGLWHGAGWTFVLWGALHGAYLVLNHLWVELRDRLFGAGVAPTHKLARLLGWSLTFLAVVVGWVFFRADSTATALTMLHAMAGQDGMSLPMALAHRMGAVAEALRAIGVGFHLGGGGEFAAGWAWIVVCFVVAHFAPNTQQIMAQFTPALAVAARGPAEAPALRAAWRPGPAWAVGLGLAMALCILSLSQVSEFLYFQF